MLSFIATYDLRETNPDPHTTFLNKSRSFGWNYWILSTTNNTWYRLPNTTLVGQFETMDTAVTALEATRVATQHEMGRIVNMDKWIVTQFLDGRFNSDDQQRA
jgi:hypothetical protein